jgi:hypothetical protein
MNIMDVIYILVLIAAGADEPMLLGPFNKAGCDENIELVRNAAYEAELPLVAKCLPLTPVSDGIK